MSLADNAVWYAVRSLFRLQLLEAVRAHPGIDARAIADATGASTPRVFYHLKILVKAGLLEAKESNNRRNSRGPVAMVYHPCCEDFSPIFFARDGRARERARKLQRMLAEDSIAASFPRAEGDGASDGHWRLFRWEALREEEIASIRVHAEAIERILQGAKSRRRREKSLPAANMQVAILLASGDLGVMPDGGTPPRI
ncbi:MAG: winged helix-turn-helix transcriptional regulator [Planctomycetota bacterium]